VTFEVLRAVTVNTAAFWKTRSVVWYKHAVSAKPFDISQHCTALQPTIFVTLARCSHLGRCDAYTAFPTELAPHLSWDVLSDAGFLCNKAAVLWSVIKDVLHYKLQIQLKPLFYVSLSNNRFEN
jgi:hypothetical protein